MQQRKKSRRFWRASKLPLEQVVSSLDNFPRRQ